MSDEEKTRKKPSKDCLDCGGELAAVVSITRQVPLAATGGNVKVSGITVSQIDLREEFCKDRNGNDKVLRGPIFCTACGEEHYLHVGKRTTLRKGNVDMAYVNKEHLDG